MFNKLPVWARAEQAGQLPFSAFDQDGTGQRYVVDTLCRCIADWAGPQTRRKKASGSCFASGDVYTTNGAGSARRGKREIVATCPSSRHRHRAAIQETMSTGLQCRRVCPGTEFVYLGSKSAQSSAGTSGIAESRRELVRGEKTAVRRRDGKRIG